MQRLEKLPRRKTNWNRGCRARSHRRPAVSGPASNKAAEPMVHQLARPCPLRGRPCRRSRGNCHVDTSQFQPARPRVRRTDCWDSATSRPRAGACRARRGRHGRLGGSPPFAAARRTRFPRAAARPHPWRARSAPRAPPAARPRAWQQLSPIQPPVALEPPEQSRPGRSPQLITCSMRPNKRPPKMAPSRCPYHSSAPPRRPCTMQHDHGRGPDAGPLTRR